MVGILYTILLKLIAAARQRSEQLGSNVRAWRFWMITLIAVANDCYPLKGPMVVLSIRDQVNFLIHPGQKRL